MELLAKEHAHGTTTTAAIWKADVNVITDEEIDDPHLAVQPVRRVYYFNPVARVERALWTRHEV